MTALALGLLGATYFVDPERGDDAASGHERPWRTLARASRGTYRPGDRLLLVGVLHGPLRLRNVQGLTVASKDGSLARIDGGKGDGIVVEGGRDIRIERILLTGAGRKANDGRGILLSAATNASVAHVEVSGYRRGGVEILGCKTVLLERVIARENGAAGIQVSGGDGGTRSKDVTIRECRALNNPGDPKNLSNHSGNGIVVGGVDDCLIEYCEAAENGWDMPRKGNGPVGIWAWNARHVTIRRCISHHNKSPGADGGGFDLDGGVVDSVLEGNLSYANAGTGYLLCQYPGGGTWRGNVVRNNVSFNDGQKNFQSGLGLYLPEGMDNMAGCVVERNTIVNPRYAVATMGDIPGLVYRNNVFVAGLETLKVAQPPGGFRRSRFEGNLVASEKTIVGEDSSFPSAKAWGATGGKIAAPLLTLPKSVAELPTDPRRLHELTWFRPLPSSPCVVDGKVAIGASL